MPEVILLDDFRPKTMNYLGVLPQESIWLPRVFSSPNRVLDNFVNIRAGISQNETIFFGVIILPWVDLGESPEPEVKGK